MSKRLLNALEVLAESCGLEVVCVNEAGGHYQVTGGPMLVNWYPFSAKQTAYVKATTKGVQNATPEQVIKMATSAPSGKCVKAVRKASRGKRAKKRLMVKHPFCHWCKEPLTADNATLEHVVPLARGGLDHHCNMTLACRACNEKRGSNMPELNKEQSA
jgi:5-methylcytosine-specific restriction endonuclease McrA